MTDAHTASLAAETIRTSSLYNKDLAPVSPERRTWGTYNYAALWISMSVNIPTYLLASGMIAGGMSWKQALFTVFLGNVLVLIPMLVERPRRNALRHSLPRFRARLVRRAGCQRARDFARAGRVRLVRHSDVDWRRSDQRHAHRTRSRLAALSIRPGDLLRFLLAAERSGHPARH